MTARDPERNLSTPRLRGMLVSFQKGLCARCGQLLPKRFEIHHKERWAMGGLTTMDNLEALCPSCHRTLTRGEDHA